MDSSGLHRTVGILGRGGLISYEVESTGVHWTMSIIGRKGGLISDRGGVQWTIGILERGGLISGGGGVQWSPVDCRHNRRKR